MGTGKSTWAIKYMNFHRGRNYICVLPLLTECERYRSCLNARVFEPEHSRGQNKLASLKQLIRQQANIVTTHALFQCLDAEAFELLKQQDYTIFIDECLNVLQTIPLSEDDRDLLIDTPFISLDDDDYIVWNPVYDDYNGKFNTEKRMCELKTLIGCRTRNGSISKNLLWCFPTCFFECFRECYILTYLWEGSIQKTYFDMHQISYEKFTLSEDGKLIPYDPQLEYDRRQIAAKSMNIYDDHLNRIGDTVGRSRPLSKSWYLKKSKTPEGRNDLIKVKRCAENYFRSISRTEAKFNMYTTYDGFQKLIKGRAYTKGFVPCNARGTNDFRHKKALAYLIDFNFPPELHKLAKMRRVSFDEDLAALSTLLQWIWRSRIRDDEEIWLYIPSERMRNLLYDWIDGKDLQ